MRHFFLCIAFLSLPAAYAAQESKNAWGDLYGKCSGWNMPKDFKEWSQKAMTKYESTVARTRLHLNKFVNQTCPQYLKDPNALSSVGQAKESNKITLHEFVAAQKEAYTDAMNVDSSSQLMENYLLDSYSNLDALFKVVKLPPMKTTQCGTQIASKVQQLRATRTQIEQEIQKVKTDCFAIAEKEIKWETAEAKARGPAGKKFGNGGPGDEAAASGRKNPPTDSTITGDIHPDTLK